MMVLMETYHLAKLDYVDENKNPRSQVELRLFTIEHKYFAKINHYLIIFYVYKYNIIIFLWKKRILETIYHFL
jgi:hypothetical protein